MLRDRIINIVSNGGMYFITPLAGTTLAQAPSVEASLYSMMIGFVLSASREGLDHVREQQERPRKRR